MIAAESTRKIVLGRLIDADPDDIDESGQEPFTYIYGHREYMVMTDSEATERAIEYVGQMIWTLDPELIADVTGLSPGVIEHFQLLDPADRDNAVEFTRKMGCSLRYFSREVIDRKGRGYFLSSADQQEVRMEYDGETWYVYRIA